MLGGVPERLGWETVRGVYFMFDAVAGRRYSLLMTNTKTTEHGLRNANGEYTIFSVYGDGVHICSARLKAGRGGYGHIERRVKIGSERFVSVEAARAEYKSLRAAGAVVGNL